MPTTEQGQPERISRADQKRWARIGRETLETLPLPRALVDVIRPTLDTPQWGPYHNEGLRMDAHLGAILDAAEQIRAGTFDFTALGLPPDRASGVQQLLERVARERADDLTTYAYLHDLKKPDTMNVELADGSQKIFTMADWEAIVAEAGGEEERIRASLAARGITKIGYRHTEDIAPDGQSHDHGPEGAAHLEQLAGQDPEVAAFLADKRLVLTGVAAHEMHFQAFPGTSSAKQYAEKIAARFSPEEVDFVLAVNFLDIAGSKGPDGKSDYVGFRNMVEARAAHERITAFQQQREATGRPLRENEIGELLNAKGLAAVEQKITKLEKPPEPTALTPEQRGAAETKLADWIRDLKIPPEQEPAIRVALASDHYARELGALKLGKLTGVIKQFVAELGS